MRNKIFFMKYFLKIFFLILICNNLNAADKYEGHGPLTLKNVDVNIFKEYMSPPAGHSPSAFYVLIENGEVIWSTYWYCPAGNCQTHVKSEASKRCRIAAEKYYQRSIFEDCKIFARKRTIVWKNGINPGRGKISKVSSKWDKKKLEAKLTELGFLGDNVSSNNTTNNKKKKKNDTSKMSNEDIQHLKDLKKLLDEGILTQEEFNSAKKKVLE